MHDLDRTYLEDEDARAFPGEGERCDGEDGHGEDGEDHDGEDGHGEDGDGEATASVAGYEGEGSEVLHEDEVTELAAELLGASSEQEVDHFLGGLIEPVAVAHPQLQLFVHYASSTRSHAAALSKHGHPNVRVAEARPGEAHCDIPRLYWQRRIQAALRAGTPEQRARNGISAL
jgi:hypothetical protein